MPIEPLRLLCLVEHVHQNPPTRLLSGLHHDFRLTPEEACWISRAVETYWLIEQLREPEAAELTLMCDNPDFNGQPDAKIEIVDTWTRWSPRVFTGNNVLECLRAALAARSAERGKP